MWFSMYRTDWWHASGGRAPLIRSATLRRMKGFVAACLVLAATLASLALAPAARAEGDQRWVQTPRAFLRDGPGREHAPTARLPIATVVEVLSCSARWCE